ncbi:hypothetical protein [Streptomyces camelliae]|uniref:Uncharacterized protein n=1 Tax=Streptomyces camelliae TaxID=3004093 RepID=A0ABY7P574_9ACTN|nr:hypothetical protein [Streptomyces sp. HUAS 2-6]WBO65686.1 hypothetical protein O1G22_24150 [Streptomyces sp. HUAS 2-6]
MIGLRIKGKAVGRSGRVGLLLGLVVIIVVHLAGTVHGASFEESHLDAVQAVGAYHSADGGHGASDAPTPEHDHKTGGHIDHAADRPRSVSADDVVVEPAAAGPALIPAATTGPFGTGATAPGDPPGGKGSPDGRFTLALHCIWRQ